MTAYKFTQTASHFIFGFSLLAALLLPLLLDDSALIIFYIQYRGMFL